ncbi:unnamed protein product [Orchesella dallaii]|uniref:Uncharacterized protein n=1 Tax=Orchesella dallaii TaxID=48710 RepID=A0ABP1QPS1_9HEXA
MMTPVSENSRKVARIVGWTHSVVYGAIVVSAAFGLVSMMWMGYEMQLYGFGGENLESLVVDSGINNHLHSPAKMDDEIKLRSDEIIIETILPRLWKIVTIAQFASFAFATHQSYGAYLLLQASRVNTKPSDALGNVNTNLKIQMVYMWVDVVQIIAYIWLLHGAIFNWSMLLFFFCRCASIRLVKRFRSELQAAAAPSNCKTSEKETMTEGKAAAAFAVSIPE